MHDQLIQLIPEIKNTSLNQMGEHEQ